MGGGSAGPQRLGLAGGQSQGPLVLRAATKADLDAITQIMLAGFPDDPGCDYKFPYRNEYPDDFWHWTRLEYEEYLDQPAKFASLVVTAPVTQDDGEVSHVPIAIGVWDIAVETKSTGGDRGIHSRRDANPVHMKVYADACSRGWNKHFAGYCNTQLNLWMLITHPDFRNRGAGTMLCNWGQKEAVKNGKILTVMASPMGKNLYEYLGYKLVGAEKVQAEGEEETFDIYILVKKKLD